MGKDVYGRRLRGGMVGGAEGAFIGPVHRMAATMDGQAEFVAGCFSRDAASSSTSTPRASTPATSRWPSGRRRSRPRSASTSSRS
jgi:hypothetical protein